MFTTSSQVSINSIKSLLLDGLFEVTLNDDNITLNFKMGKC